ncbi:hypothetical protein ACC691_36810 [Rhizobium johnstonii]|uniref:hypothetical protein n=1 Tax=Rhizobium johnstonii TaxID=3019933 RepID=UPI003F9DF3F3
MRSATAIAAIAGAVLAVGGVSAGAVAMQKAFDVDEAPAVATDVPAVVATTAPPETVPSADPQADAPAQPSQTAL